MERGYHIVFKLSGYVFAAKGKNHAFLFGSPVPIAVPDTEQLTDQEDRIPHGSGKKGRGEGNETGKGAWMEDQPGIEVFAQIL